MSSDPSGPESRSRSDQITYLIAQYRLLIGGGIVVLIGLQVAGIISIPGLPSWILPLSLSLGVSGVVGYLAAQRVVSQFFPDNREIILELDFDAETGSTKADIHLAPGPMWSNREQGEHPALSPDSGAVDAVVSSFEFDEDLIRVEGSNPELSNPISLAARKGQFESVKSDIIQEAERADRLEQTLELRALEMQREIAQSIISGIETGAGVSEQSVSRIARADAESLSFGAEQRERAESEESEQEGAKTNGKPEQLENALDNWLDGRA